MDIEMVQKVNKLAVDLLNQGMVTSRIEAVKKAEEMLSRDGSRILSDMEKAEPVQKTVADEPQKPEPDLEELKSAMLKNNEYFVKTFKEMQTALSGLSSELAGIKQELHDLKKSAAARPPQATLNALQEKVGIAKPAEKAQSHPMQGGFSPEDVSVEKIFYMGNK